MRCRVIQSSRMLSYSTWFNVSKERISLVFMDSKRRQMPQSELRCLGTGIRVMLMFFPLQIFSILRAELVE